VRAGSGCKSVKGGGIFFRNVLMIFFYRQFSYQKSRGMDISFEVRFYLLKQEKTITYF